jgi:predicted nucleic acid-binding protein
MIVLDASIVIVHFAPSGSYHEAATEMLRRTASEALSIHALTLSEVLVHAARQGREDWLAGEVAALGISTWPMDADAPVRLARLRATRGLPMPDCCVLDAAVVQDASVMTFDRRLATAAGEIGLVVAG